MDEQDIERIATAVIKAMAKEAGVPDSAGNHIMNEGVGFAVIGEIAGRFIAGRPEGRQDEGMKLLIQATHACTLKWKDRPKEQKVFLMTANHDGPRS